MSRIVHVDDQKLKAAMRFYPSLIDLAGFFDCTPRFLQKYIRDNFDMTFLEFRDHYMGTTRMRLRQVAIEKALRGDNQMLKFVLTNVCGWNDKGEQDQSAQSGRDVTEVKAIDRKALIDIARDKSKGSS